MEGEDVEIVSSWSIDKVITEICHKSAQFQVKPSLDLAALETALRANDIDGETLLELNDENIKEDLGITSLGQRREVRRIVLELQERIATTSSTSSKRAFEVDPTSSPQDQRQKKRRIQPHSVSTTPVTVKQTTAVNAQVVLEDHWKDLLARYPHEDDDDLTAMNGDHTHELHRDNDNANYHAATDDEPDDSDSPETEEQTSALPRHEVDAVINTAIYEIKTKWAMQKQHAKYKNALQHWNSAVKAKTRRPVQQFINRELQLLQARLERMRKYIMDMKFSELNEVKQACLNLEATVEDCAEREYYLRSLDSQHPPVAPPQRAQDTTAEVLKSRSEDPDLSTDEEIIDSGEERSEDEDSVGSDEEVDSNRSFRAQSLPSDLFEEDWHPVIETQSEEGPHSTEVTPDDFDFLGDSIEDVDRPASPLENAMQLQTIDSSEIYSRPLDEDTFESEMKEAHEMVQIASAEPAARQVSPDPYARYQSIPRPIAGREVGSSDELRSPSGYDAQGRTRESAIHLSSSSVGSPMGDSETEDIIKTPPLNPFLKTEANANITPMPLSQQPQNLRQKWSSQSPWINKRAEPGQISQPRDVATLQDFRHHRFPPIGETRRKKWRDVKSPELSLCKFVYGMDRKDCARPLLDFTKYIDKQKRFLPSLLTELIAMTASQDLEDITGVPQRHTAAARFYAFCFVCYICCRGFERRFDKVRESDWDKASEKTSVKAQRFHDYLVPLLEFYISSKSQKDLDTPTKAPSYLEVETQRQDTDVSVDIDDFSSADSGEDSNTEAMSPSKRRKRHVEESQEAKEMQLDDRQRVESQEERRQLLMARFRAHAMSGEQIDVPINTTIPTVYLDHHIASRVKPHQITGIQFLWRELIDDPKMQGCLLAHTMGLGKTMQVISLLVTVAQCLADHSPEVRALIPERFHGSKVLILCPVTLVENWFDELLMWCREPQQLGQIYKISGNIRKSKVQTVYEWRKNSGVLLTGYETFRSLLNEKLASSEDELAQLEEALLEQPTIVVADEAHKLKNPKSNIAQLSQRFKTTGRIALTGSPLNNHLEEYHTMIDWIAPGYLGNIKQFKAKYIDIINRGLYSESTTYEKRKSLEKLYVLKRDLAPKINRADISAISAEMPHKVEFYLTVPLTQVQRDIYGLLVGNFQNKISYLKGGSHTNQQIELWKWLSILSWLCNHPSALLNKLLQREETDIETARAQYRSSSPNEGGMEDALAQDLDVSQTDLVGLVPQIVKILDRANIKHRDDPSLSVRADMTRCIIKEAEAQGDKTLLFSHSIPTLDYLETVLGQIGSPFMRIDGSTKVQDRQLITKAFNDEGGDCNVFLISTRAGGLGLNLQGANRVIIFDFGFNPSWEQQAIGRAYRLGQQKPVYVYRFKAGGTFEDALYNKNVFKTQLFSRVVDQKNVIRHASRNVEQYIFYPREVEQTDFSECCGKDAVLDQIVQANPGFVRNVILTETFHREDEEDQLTKEEQEIADKEFELERLARTNPEEADRRRAADMRRMDVGHWGQDRAFDFGENFTSRLTDGRGRPLPDRSKLSLQNSPDTVPVSAPYHFQAHDDSVVNLMARNDATTKAMAP